MEQDSEEKMCLLKTPLTDKIRMSNRLGVDSWTSANTSQYGAWNSLGALPMGLIPCSAQAWLSSVSFVRVPFWVRFPASQGGFLVRAPRLTVRPVKLGGYRLC